MLFKILKGIGKIVLGLGITYVGYKWIDKQMDKAMTKYNDNKSNDGFVQAEVRID